jgi:hypothetical protein
MRIGGYPPYTIGSMTSSNSTVMSQSNWNSIPVSTEAASGIPILFQFNGTVPFPKIGTTQLSVRIISLNGYATIVAFIMNVTATTT